jgi:two-component system sensor histidine kinase BarA
MAATRDKAYDLILMDLSMPDMDGFATAAAIRTAGASQKAAIVALTANILARDEVEKPGSAFDGLQLKPLRLDELRTWLASGRFTPRPVDAPALIDEGIAGDLVEMMPAAAIEPLLGALFNEALTLAADLDGGATEGLAKRFHRVAGSAGMLGAARLRALAIQAELDCQDSKHVPDAAFRTTWRQTITETSKAWAARLAEKPETAAATSER